MNADYSLPGNVLIGDFFNHLSALDGCDFVFADPPYENDTIYWMLFQAMRIDRCVPGIMFMYPDNWIASQSDQVVHWVKPVSTKNTSRRYSSFVEAIAVWHGDFFSQNLHWSTRTGVFTDTLIDKQIHPHQKPYSLVEKLILLHTPPGGTVLDPFCGSQVVRRVCDKHGFRSLSIDLKDWLDNRQKV